MIKSMSDLLWSQRLSSAACHIIVALMMALLLVPVVLVAQRILLGWDGGYLVGIGLLISLEALFSRRRLHGRHFPEPAWLVFRITEWIVILVGLKFLIYGLRGVGQVWTDLALWRVDFFHNFFSNEYLLACLVAFVIWALSGELGELLELLEGDEQLLEQEEDVSSLVQRSLVRDRLANIFIFLGAIMVVLTAFLRLESGRGWNETPLASASAYAVLAYFLLGLVLLSLTQFSILRARWLLDRMPVQRRIAFRWLVGSFILLAGLVFVASLLPTGYSVGLLEILALLLGYLVRLVMAILTLLIMPFILLAGWIMSLFNVKLRPIETPQMPLPPPPLRETGPGPAWFELLKSIIFWGLLLGMVVFSFAYYLREHRESLERLARLPLLGWIIQLFRRTLDWARSLGRRTAEQVSAWRRLRQPQPSLGSADGPIRFINPRRLTARQQVCFYYLAMVRRGRDAGLPRQADQTPYEYALRLEAGLQAPAQSAGQGAARTDSIRERAPEPAAELNLSIDSISAEFVEARYSLHAVTSQQAGLARAYWERIRQALRRRKNVQSDRTKMEITK
jgi:hypothetical protein